MPTTLYQDFVVLFAPGFFLKKWGKAFLQGVAKVVDEELVDRAKESVKAHICEVAPVSALPTLGRERLLERYPPMSDDDYRNYLLAVWDVWPGGGTEGGMLAAFNAALPGPVYEVLEQVDGGGYVYSGWNAFYIHLTAFLPWSQWTYGSGYQWGKAGLTWGSTATPADVAFLRALAKKWKGGHNHLQGIILDLDTEIIWPGTPDITP